MLLRFRRAVVCACAVLSFAVPRLAAAQDTTIAPVTASPLSEPAPLLTAAAPTAPPQAGGSQLTAASRANRGALAPMYVAFGTLQALDIHSTLRAVNSGAGTEQNLVLRGIANNPAALIAVKSGVTAATILLADTLRVRHRTGALVLMAALNSAFAVVVAHNYSIH